MNILYIPQLDDLRFAKGGSDTAATGTTEAYKMVDAMPVDGKIQLKNHTLTRITITENAPVKIIVPPYVPGEVRDFVVRLMVRCDEIPEFDFYCEENEYVNIEYWHDVDLDFYTQLPHTMVFSFFETDTNCLTAINLAIETPITIEFDACGGTMDECYEKMQYVHGEMYNFFPTPVWPQGKIFDGWFTAPGNDGVMVNTYDDVSFAITKLYAHWHNL